MIFSRFTKALSGVDWKRQNLRIRKVVTTSLLGPLIVVIGPAVDLITAPAASAAVTTETAINVGRNTQVSEPFAMSFGVEPTFAIYIELVNPATDQYLTMATTFSTTNDYFGGSSSSFTKAVFIGTSAEFNSTFNSGSNKFKLVTGSTANPNTSIRWAASPLDTAYKYSTDNHHFYKFITVASTSWSSAATSANGFTFLGAKGYLATVSSATENANIANAGANSSATSGAYWIGAGDDALEGVWRWTASNTNAPESGKIFYTEYCVNNSGSAPGSTPTTSSCSQTNSHSNSPQGSLYTLDGFTYANWNGSTWSGNTFTPGNGVEPNNADGTSGEDFASMIMDSGLRGKWNDLRDGNTPSGYVVEFGEATSELKPSSYSQKSITSFAFSTVYSALSTTFGTAASSTTPATTGGRSSISYSINNSGHSAITINSSTGVVTASSAATSADSGTYTVTATENSGAAGDAFTVTSTISVTISRLVLTTPGSLNVSATTGVAKSIGVTWTDVSNETAYTITLLEGATLRATIALSANATSKTITTSDYSGLADGTVYTINLVAVGNSTQYDTSTAASTTVTTNISARTATFGTATRQSLGFTVPISNYDATFTYETATSSAGAASRVGSNIVVTGLTKGAGATVGISTRKSGYASTTSSSGLYYALETATAITFTAKTLTKDIPYKILYSADANNPNKPSYTSSTLSICTVSQETITPIAIGTCSISATLVGYSTYDTVTATTSFSVNGSPFIGVGSYSNRTYGDDTSTVQLSGSSGVAPYTYQVVKKSTGLPHPTITVSAAGVLSIGKYTPPGTETITATVFDANGAQSSTDLTFKVFKKAPIFTITAVGDTTTTISKPLSFTITTSEYGITGTVSLYTGYGSSPLMGDCSNLDISAGSVSCTWNSDAVTSGSNILLTYSGDTNYLSRGNTSTGAESNWTSGPVIVVNGLPFASYSTQNITYGVTTSYTPISVVSGTGPRSAWTWAIVRASDSQTVTGFSLNQETVTVASTVAVGTYDMIVQITDAKGAVANRPATVIVGKATATFTLTADTASATIGNSILIRFTSTKTNLNGTLKVYESDQATLASGCSSVSIVNSVGSCSWTRSNIYGPNIVYWTYSGDSNYNDVSTKTSSSPLLLQFFPHTSLVYSSLTTPYGTAANFPGVYLSKGGGAANTWSWSISRTSNGASVSGISMSNETITVSNSVPAATYAMRITTIDGLGDVTTKDVSIVVTQLTGLTPTFGAVTRTANGFTTSITNFNANYSFAISTNVGTVDSGTVTGSTLPITVSGLSDSATAIVSVTTSRDNYTSPSASVSGSALALGLTPTFGTVTRTAGGFTVSVTNWSSSYTWTESVTAGSVSAGVGSGSTRLYTISGLTQGQSATLYVSDTSTATKIATAFVSGTAKSSQTAVSVTKTSGTYPSETLTATGGSGTGGYIFTVSDLGTANCSISGTSIIAQAAGTCLVIASKATDADYLAESSTATTFTFSAANALTVRAVGGTVSYKATSQYNPAITVSGFVSSDSGTVTSPTYTYAGINGSSYSSSATKPTAVGTYSVTPSAGTFSFSQGYLAGYASPVNYVSDTLTVIASVPDSPTAVVVTVTSSTSVSVAFTAPVNTGGVAIDSYLITNGSNAITATGSSSPISVTGLSAGTAYTFKVNAINSAGRSDTATATQVYTKLGVSLSPSSVTGYYGTPITSIIPTIYGGSGITYSVSPTLPAGLSVALNGVISGTPTETKTATTYTETATYGAYTNGSATFTLTILKGDASVTTPSVSPATPTFGSTLTFSSTVTSANSRVTLTGTISFKDGANSTLCTTPTISAGVGSCTYTPLTAETFTVRAFYSGMTYVDSATSSALTIVPTKVNPSITAAASVTKLLIGATSTVTATIVTGTATNATGTVSFTSNSDAISGCSSVSVASNIATCSFTSSNTGTFVVAASYAGDSNYNGAASSSVTITVSSCTQSSTGLTLSTGAPAAGYCAVSITAGTSGSLGLPVGVISMTARVLVIGGGGAGGPRHGGGGGAGSLLNLSAYSISDTSTVTIGAGGASTNVTPTALLNSGGSTTFGSLVLAGGGSGGGIGQGTGLAGGSGGGGAAGNAGANGVTATIAGTSVSVGNGSTGVGSGAQSTFAGGGGGGAGGNATNASATSPATPGKGGNGFVSDLTLDGSYACYAAGGAGGSYSGNPVGVGGGCTGLVTSTVGGAGNAYAQTAGSGVANTGSGGGGGGFEGSTNYYSGAGGSGLVALRFISPATITISNDSTVVTNTSVTLTAASVAFTNLSARAYQWQKWESATAAWKNETSTALTYTFTAHYNGESIQKYRLLVTDTDGTLQTVSSSRVINLTVTPLTQPTLVVSTTYSVAGVSLSLLTSGGGGLGAVTYTYVASGSAAGCSLSGSILSLATSGICKVLASKAADLDYLAATSDTATISFVSFQMTVQARPANPITGIATSGTTTISKGSSACSSACVPTISSLSVYSGRAGDSIVITGTNLSGATKVIFNAFTNASTFSNDLSTPDTKITVQVPSGLTPGETGIEVVTPGGTSARNFDFEVLP